MGRILHSARAASHAYRLALAALCLIVVTGASVRLTGSGLGCSTWPACDRHRLVAAWQYHSLVEFGNRMVTVVVTLAVLGAVIAALSARPRRRDLVWLSVGTLMGVVGQAVLGGITVLVKLAPGWVMAHFLLSMVVIAVGVSLVQRDRQGPGLRTPRVAPEVVWVSRLMVGLGAAVLGLGTVVTGSGPHSGSPGVARLGLSVRDAAEAHSTLVMLLIGVTLATLLLLRPSQAPRDLERRSRVLLYVLVAQGALGYTQYFTGVPAALVGLHVAGAVLAWVALLFFHLSLWTRVPVGSGDLAGLAAPPAEPRRRPSGPDGFDPSTSDGLEPATPA